MQMSVVARWLLTTVIKSLTVCALLFLFAQLLSTVSQHRHTTTTDVSSKKNVTTIKLNKQRHWNDDGLMSKWSSVAPSATASIGTSLGVKAATINTSSTSTFLFSAYLIADNAPPTVRLVTVRKCENRQAISFNVTINDTKSATHALVTFRPKFINNKCPWAYNAACSWGGWYLDGRLPPGVSENAKSLTLTLSRVDSTSAELPLLDVRKTPEGGKLSLLNVCVQPVFLYSDWLQLIQYIEGWLALGATRLYIYVQSVTKEVDSVLMLYEGLGIVERVWWSLFPGSTNVNIKVYRTDVVTALNDCLLRNRGRAKFVALTDLDELIVPLLNVTLGEYLTKMEKKRPVVASILFRSSTVHFKREPLLFQPTEAVNLSSLQFNYLSMVQREQFVWPSGRMSKLIVRPEMVVRVHVHQTMELLSGSTTETVAQTTGLVYHLRKPRSAAFNRTAADGGPTKTVTDSTMSDLVNRMNDAWRRHLRAASVSFNHLPSRGVLSMTKLQTCAGRLYRNLTIECMAQAVQCKDELGIDSAEWVSAPNSWFVL